VEGIRDGIKTRHVSRDERAALAARTGFARTRLVPRAIARAPLRVTARETRSIESVSGGRPQITGSCYFLLSIREAHDLVGYSGR
jgi:hypothetical protein